MINGNIEIQVEIKTNMNTILETRKPKSEEMGSFFCGSNHLVMPLMMIILFIYLDLVFDYDDDNAE